MAHIADFMVDATSSVGLNNYIARELSPHPPPQELAPETTPVEEKERFIWRMHQPTEPRKYQLFPVKDKLSISAGRKSPDSESVFSIAMGKAGNPEKERSLHAAALRLKPKEQILVRRRKVSVPELGPMTTVQEVAMDSPTIPGRPALHERSISAPGNSWRQHVFGESMLSGIDGPALDEAAEIDLLDIEATMAAMSSSQETLTQNSTSNPRSASPKQPLSPRSLAPLVIPSTSSTAPLLAQQSSYSRLRSVDTPPDVPPKSARLKDASPHSRVSPFTPMSSASTTSLSTAPTSHATTPNTGITGESSPWTTAAGPSPVCHVRGQSETTQSRIPPTFGHRRVESEASIMDRGRPKKRSDSSPSKPSQGKLSSNDEQKAFETLPQGIKATDASTALPVSEIDVLRKQAMGQASRFEVLRPKDVETLSRELRGLDERCDYLRKTHRSLRSGRRNLHDRICTYLRSPRVARFSHESILKQEEALSELDRSIDDWVSKLEQAENRRTRIRQKLLEHVAAALIIQPSANNAGNVVAAATTGSQDTEKLGNMHIGMQRVPMGENTPPRSPTKSTSPQRLAEPVRVDIGDDSDRQSISIARRDVESIRIYADSDMYALLADVEDEINRMGEGAESKAERERDTAEAADTTSKDVPSTMASGGVTLSAVAFSGSVLPKTSFA